MWESKKISQNFIFRKKNGEKQQKTVKTSWNQLTSHVMNKTFIFGHHITSIYRLYIDVVGSFLCFNTEVKSYFSYYPLDCINKTGVMAVVTLFEALL
jgi:hypothetical protein